MNGVRSIFNLINLIKIKLEKQKKIENLYKKGTKDTNPWVKWFTLSDESIFY